MSEIEKYEKAGKIAFKVLQESKKLVKPGVKLLDVAEKLEEMIAKEGAKPAFPLNISLNEAAAHYTPEYEDELVFGEKDLVKIDVGAHIDGFIGDTALTIDLSEENGKLVEASQQALENAINSIKAGVKTSEIGEIVEKTIKEAGFKPIENLTGHSLGEYNLHAGVEIPNIKTPYSHELKEGDFVAIEPFATAGAGRVSDGPKVEIFSLLERTPCRMREARRLLNHAEENYKELPFAERWLRKRDFKSKLLLHSALRELLLLGALRQYPVLKDAEKGLVSQAEATVVVEKDSARILTK